MDNANETKLITLNVNGSWQPTSVKTGKTSNFWAFRRCYVVISRHGTVFHGNWTEMEQANRFAQSMGDGDLSKASKVAPYWYAPAYGVVE